MLFLSHPSSFQNETLKLSPRQWCSVTFSSNLEQNETLKLSSSSLIFPKRNPIILIPHQSKTPNHKTLKRCVGQLTGVGAIWMDYGHQSSEADWMDHEETVVGGNMVLTVHAFPENTIEDVQLTEMELEDGDGENFEVCEGGQIIHDVDASDDITGSLVGCSADTLDEIYLLYRRHSCAVGFSVRKATQRRSPSEGDKVTEKYYVCSHSGFNNTGNPKKVTVFDAHEPGKKNRKPRRVPCTRTGCNASIRVKLNEQGKYVVLNHVLKHNHDLVRPELSRFHRSERSMTSEKGQIIEEMHVAGIRPVDSYRYMCNEAGGDHNLGHTLKDHYNYVQKLKMQAIEAGDAQTVVDMLHQQAADEPGFFFRVRFDGNGRLCNVFWRDSMMREDYDIFSWRIVSILLTGLKLSHQQGS